MAKRRQNKGESDVADLPEIVQNGTRPDMVGMPLELLQELIAGLRAGRQAPGGEDNPALQAAIRAIEAQAATTEKLAEEFKRTVRRSNETHTGISAFTFDFRCEICKDVARGSRTATHRDELGEPLGQAHPKPALRYETFFCGGRQREDQLTPLEIELFNAFEASRESRDGAWQAILSRDGLKKRLAVNVPAAYLDDMMSLPPLTQILSELLYGSEIANPDLAMARILELEKKIAELEKARPSSGL